MVTSAMHPEADSTGLRLLECWLPFAQALAQELQWPYDYAALEELILRAAPTLRGVSSVAIARVILVQSYLRSRGQP